MRVSRIMMFMIVGLLSLWGVTAQDDESGADVPELSQPVAISENVTFRIPEDWIALESNGQITIASSQATIESVTEAGPVPEGELFASVFGGAFSRVLEIPPDDVVTLAQNIAEMLSGQLGTDFSEVETFTAGEHPAALVSWTFVEGELSLDAGVIFVSLSDTFQAVFWYVTSRADFNNYTALMREVAATTDGSALGPEVTPEPAPSDEFSAADLTQIFTSEAEDLTLFVPETWAVTEDEGQVYFGTSEAAVESLTADGGALPPGAMSVIVLTGQIALGLGVTDAPEDVVVELAEGLLETTETEAISDVFSFTTEDERSGAFQAWGYTLGSSPFSAGVLALRQSEEEYLVFLFTVRDGDAAPYVAALQTIAANALTVQPE